MTRGLRTAGFAVAIITLSGCQDDLPPPTPPGMPGTSSGQMPAGHPAVDQTAPGMPGTAGSPTAPDLPTAPSGTIDGRIELGAEVRDKAKAGDAIYIVARNAATGSIVAASRVVAPEEFPVTFSLGGDDVMHTKTSLAGKVKLEARLDKDGDAMTKKPGDLVGEAKDLVSVPAKDVVVTLDRVL